ncbi:hypothetical protein GCM10009608_00540 [Pseudonocardia alaniniphila]
MGTQTSPFCRANRIDSRTSSVLAARTTAAGWIESNFGLNSWWAAGYPLSPRRKSVPSRPLRNPFQSGAAAAERVGRAAAGLGPAATGLGGTAVADSLSTQLARAARASTPPALRAVRRSILVTIDGLLPHGCPWSPT